MSTPVRYVLLHTLVGGERVWSYAKSNVLAEAWAEADRLAEHPTRSGVVVVAATLALEEVSR